MSAIPRELRDLDQWVVYRIEQRNGKATKVPYQPDGQLASTTDPSTWLTRQQARDAEGFAGTGFVFTEQDEYCGVDLDHCRDPETGQIEKWARAIINDLNSYAEVSQSGEGVHIICRAKLPPGNRVKKLKDRRQVEVYDTGRYFVMTGQHLPNTPRDIHDRQAEIDALHERLFAKREPEPRDGYEQAAQHTDDELIAKAQRAKNGEAFRRLWVGDRTGYESDSEADLALCRRLAFWTNRDAERIDRLYRRSGLLRPKWDEWRGNETYGERTMRHVVTARAGDASDAIGGEPVDFDAPDTPPTPIVDRLIMRDQIALLVDDEGQGKSFLAEAIASHVHAGARLADRRVQRGAVVLLDGQMGAPRLRRRFALLYRGLASVAARKRQSDPEAMFDKLRTAYGYPYVVDCRSSPINILTDAGRLALLKHGKEAERRAKRPLSLLIIDTRDQLLGDAEISNPDVAERFYRVLRAFQDQFEPTPAVLVLVNARKRTQGKAINWPTQRVAGATRWKDLADTIFTLHVKRAADRRTLERVTVWAAKDRDDTATELTLDVVNRDGGTVFGAADPDVIYFPDAGGRPTKTDAGIVAIRQGLERHGEMGKPELRLWCKKTHDLGEHTVNKALDSMEAAGDVAIDTSHKPHTVRLGT
ncbi:MAG: AAA family ATPase [Dehalococcoidia bacterium]